MASNIQNQLYQNSIFWIEVEKIKPNPYQPRREFDEHKLRELGSSINQYGILQPLVVTRRVNEKAEGGLIVEYELIAGERRLRASKLIGLTQVPVIIRTSSEESKGDNDRLKLELAIIENLQREDLNPVDRAKAFQRLADDFGFKHTQIADKVGKSRVYVTNTIRILGLPEEMLTALAERTITEGHTRPLLMLSERREEQLTLYKEIITKKLNVRDAERIARHVAVDRVRHKNGGPDLEIVELGKELEQRLGTRVTIERSQSGGKIVIDFFSNEDVRNIVRHLNEDGVNKSINQEIKDVPAVDPEDILHDDLIEGCPDSMEKEDEKDMYNVQNFSI